MSNYIVRRVIHALIVLIIITCLTFLLMNLIPGGPFLSEKAPSPQVLEAMEAKYGLDQPLLHQLMQYLSDLLRGDLGVSYKLQRNRSVATIIAEMFPLSAKIGGISLIAAILFGVPLGAISAYYRGKKIDGILRGITMVGISLPGFVVATVLLILFGSMWKLVPTMGLSTWTSYLLPCFSLAYYPACYIARLTRAGMLDVLNQDYIRAARAKGLSPQRIIFKHALRNACIPVLTYLGPLTAYIVTGGFVVETVFNIPGLGRYFVQSILGRDYPIIMGTTIFLAALLIGMNLVVDILYRVVDPRIDVSKGGRRI